MVNRSTFKIFKTPLPGGSAQMAKSMAAENTIFDAKGLLEQLVRGDTYDETIAEAATLAAALRRYLRASGEAV